MFSFEFLIRVLAVSQSRPTSRGTRVCGGRESRSRLTDKASPESAIAGTTIKQRRAMITSVAANNESLPRMF